MRYTGPRNKQARREGVDLGLKTPGSKAHASLMRRLTVLPGQHGSRGRRKVSERGRQLREKQKLRSLFGINESQLKNYFAKAIEKKGNTALNLSQLLEKRLDNIVYRMGFAPTRAAARQLVNHGHVTVMKKKVDIASYQVLPGQAVTFGNTKTQKIPAVAGAIENKDFIIPGWIQKKGIAGLLKEEPTAEEIEKQVDLRLVIEYYSR